MEDSSARRAASLLPPPAVALDDDAIEETIIDLPMTPRRRRDEPTIPFDFDKPELTAEDKLVIGYLTMEEHGVFGHLSSEEQERIAATLKKK